MTIEVGRKIRCCQIFSRSGERGFLRVLLWLGLCLLPFLPTTASGSPAVQEIIGRLEPGERLVYNLPNLKKGQTLYVSARGTSGNLDPFLLLIQPGADFSVLRQAFAAELEQTIATGGDPLALIPQFAERHQLSWDDDGGPGYGAAQRFPIRKSGNYALLLRSAFARETFGGFRLLLGLDAPGLLSGAAQPTGARIATLNPAACSGGVSVEETDLVISTERPATYFFLNSIKAGETLYLYLAGPPGSGPANLHASRLWRQARAQQSARRETQYRPASVYFSRGQRKLPAALQRPVR